MLIPLFSLVLAGKLFAKHDDTYSSTAICQSCVDQSIFDPNHYYEFGYCDAHYLSVSTLPEPSRARLLYRNPPEGFNTDWVSERIGSLVYSIIVLVFALLVSARGLYETIVYPMRGSQTLLVYTLSRMTLLAAALVAFVCPYVWSTIESPDTPPCGYIAINLTLRFARIVSSLSHSCYSLARRCLMACFVVVSGSLLRSVRSVQWVHG